MSAEGGCAFLPGNGKLLFGDVFFGTSMFRLVLIGAVISDVLFLTWFFEKWTSNWRLCDELIVGGKWS